MSPQEHNVDHKEAMYERQQVVEIIQSVLKKVAPGTSVNSGEIYDELTELARLIDIARRDVSSSGASDVNDKHIPSATDELDAVVTATEDATHKIMNCCDQIQEIASGLDAEPQGKLIDQVMQIFEACSFQDITGQRINKVVTTLKEIETKIDALMHNLKFHKLHGDDVATSGNSQKDPLLNGPQLPGGGIDQSEIDRLLAEFDK